jgi:hypothetical protein
MRRVGRPPLGDAARRLIAIRLDPDVLNRLNVGTLTITRGVVRNF